MSNEERFIASCEIVGEANVRQKLNADRYSGRKAVWASDWLDQVESAKSDATKAEESSSRLRVTARGRRQVSSAIFTLLLLLLLASVLLFFKFK